MLCWSCGKAIPEAAKFCPHCEAAVEEPPTAEELGIVGEILSAMGPSVMNELREAFENSATGEEFVNRVMIGDCPVCGSSNVGNCENDPDIDNICTARCFDCGQLWCSDCEELFHNAAQCKAHDCPAWDDLDDDFEFDDGAPD